MLTAIHEFFNRTTLTALALAFCLAAPLVAWLGLYDYEGEWWHRCLYVLPLACCFGLLLAWTAAGSFFRRLLLTDRKVLVVNAALFLLVLASLIWFLGRGTDLTVNYCNASEHEIAVAVSYRPNRLESRTEGYWKLSRGSCQEITRNFLRVPAKYQFHAANEHEMRDWFAREETTWDFDHSELLGIVQGASIPQYSPGEAPARKLQGQEIAWENADVRPVTRGWFSYANAVPDWSEPKHLAPFVDVVPDTSLNEARHTVWFTKGGVTRTLEICNLQPVKASLELYHQGKRKEWKVESGFEIEPGFCKSFERTFHRTAPAFWVRAAVRGKVIKWYLGEEVLLEGGDDGASVCVDEESQNVVFHHEPKSKGCAPGESSKSFALVPGSFGGSTHETFNLTLPEELIPLPMKGDEIDVEKAKVKIRHLARWWPKRMEYIEKYGEKEPHFTVGATFNDASHNVIGITVAQAQDVSPFGTPISLKKGMVIVEAFGEPIYSTVDFLILTESFGNSMTHGGVLKTFSFKAWNGNVLEERQGTLFFNPAAWPMGEEERAAASRWGFFNGISFGLAVKLYCGGKKFRAWWYGEPFSYTACTWETEQFVARMKQFFWKEYDDANFMGKILSLVPSILSVRIVARLLGGTVVAEAIAGGAVSALEAAGWAYEEALPGADVYKEMRAAALPAAKIGALMSLLLRR